MTIQKLSFILFTLVATPVMAAEVVPPMTNQMQNQEVIQLRIDMISSPLPDSSRPALEASGPCVACRSKLRLALDTLSSVSTGILHLTGAKTPVPPPAPGQCTIQRGEASYYGRGDGFAGRRTANGERMNPQASTAAHRTARFGSIVTVKNMKNGKSVVVRINDRGPYARGRVIDVSYAAAVQIGLDRSGHAPVEIRICPDTKAPA